MLREILDRRGERLMEWLHLVPLALAALLTVFAVIAQPDASLLQGFWEIQISETGLITDPMATGGVGAALFLKKRHEAGEESA